MEYLNNVCYEEFDIMLSSLSFELENPIGKNADNSNRIEMDETHYQQLLNSHTK